MSNNERTYIRTIVKWSKSAAILATAIVLLVTDVFVSTAHAESIRKQESYQVQLAKSHQETSKIKSQLEEVNSEKQKVIDESAQKDARIQQLEQENSELKG